MILQDLVDQRVSRYYRIDDINCAITTLKVLSEVCDLPLERQVLHAAIGMHGAGGFGAQCGLLEGTLMFLGVHGRHHNIEETSIVDSCREFAGLFEKQFGSLLCRVLRPEGFDANNPPHLCEALTCNAIVLAANYLLSMREGR